MDIRTDIESYTYRQHVVSSFLYHNCLSLNPTDTVSLAVASWPTHALRDIFMRVSLIKFSCRTKIQRASQSPGL